MEGGEGGVMKTIRMKLNNGSKKKQQANNQMKDDHLFIYLFNILMFIFLIYCDWGYRRRKLTSVKRCCFYAFTSPFKTFFLTSFRI